MIISIGSDHAGYALKQEIADYLSGKGFSVLVRGAESASEPYSYVLAGVQVANDISDGRAEKGIAICGTGIGVSIICNKKPGIRCALCMNEFMARMAKQHNDANVLALGARVIAKPLAISIIDSFFGEEFLGGRHQQRIDELNTHEEEWISHRG